MVTTSSKHLIYKRNRVVINMKRKFPWMTCEMCGATFSWEFYDSVEGEGDIYFCQDCNHMKMDRSTVEVVG